MSNGMDFSFPEVLMIESALELYQLWLDQNDGVVFDQQRYTSNVISLFEKVQSHTDQELFGCYDCRQNVRDIREYYVVRDEVWDDHSGDACGGVLCIGCLEARMGRNLVRDDFHKDHRAVFPDQSDRWNSRLVAT